MARTAPSEISLTISSGDGDYTPPVIEDADDDDLASIATGTATPGATSSAPAAVGTTGQTATAPAPTPTPAPSPAPEDDYTAREQRLMDAMAAAGHPIVKVSGRRTAAEQAALYAQGRSAPGPIVTQKAGTPGAESRHQAGTATDFAFRGPDGQPSYDPSHPWDTLGRMAKVHGFEWGGDWTTLKDQGHVQAPGALSGQPSPGPGPAGAPSPAGAGAGAPKVEDATPEEVAQVGSASAADLAAIGQKPPEAPLPLYRQVLDPIAESLPMIGGATGGMLAGTAATTLGPAGTATGAVLGAGAGGWVGEQLRQLYRSTVGIEPHPDWTTSVSKTLAAGNTQMTSEMVGQGLGAALTARAVGKPGAAAAQAASDRYGLRLSAPEQSGSAIGKNLQKGFTYLSGLAKMATDNARKVGDANAVRAVREALEGLTTHDLTARETGEAAQRGVKAGLKGLRDGPIGQLYQQTKKNGPDIDLRPQIDNLFRLFKAEGTPVAVRRKLLKLLPKPLNQVTAPFRYNSTEPYHVTFEQAAKLRTRLGLSGRKYLETLGSDATSLATQWYGSLSQALKDAHPDFGTVSNLWREARTSLTAPFVRRVMRESPDVVVKALGPSPQTATVSALRDTFLRLAAHNGPATPEADAGIMAWQALRKKWFDRWVLRDGAGNPDPAGMLERMQRMNGTLHEMYGTDPLGRRVMDTATEIATALKRRVAGPSAETAGRIRSGEIYAALTSTILKGAATTAEALALTEATPGFITWLMHQPRVATAFVRAMTGKGSIEASKVLSRTMSAYLMGNGEPPPEPTTGFEPHIEDDHNAPEAPEPGQGAVRSPGVPGTPPGAVPAAPATPAKPTATTQMGMLPDVDLSSWKGLNTPLLPQIAQAAHAIAMKATEPNMADQLQYEASNRLLPGLGTMGVMYKGFKAGVVEGAGDLLSTFTSPIGIALSLTGLGPESKALAKLPALQKMAGLPEVQALTRAVHVAAGAGFYGHGLETIANATTWTERAQGVIEAATGAVAGVHGLAPHPGAPGPIPAEPPPPGTPAAPTMVPPHPATTRAVSSAEHLAEMDAQFQKQYVAWLHDPRHNQYPGQMPTRPRFKDPAQLDLEDVGGRATPRSDADVAAAKAKLDAAREAAREARGEPPKERTTKVVPFRQDDVMDLTAKLSETLNAQHPDPARAAALQTRIGSALTTETDPTTLRKHLAILEEDVALARQSGAPEEVAALTGLRDQARARLRQVQPRESLLSERGSTGRMWLNPDDPGEPPRRAAVAERDRELPKQPRWAPLLDKTGGFWVLPSGDYAYGSSAKEAQAALRERGVDPFSKSGVPSPQALAPTPKAPPGPTSIDRPWTDAPVPGLTGLYSTLERIVDDLPARGVSPRRFLAQVEHLAPEEGEWRQVAAFVRDHIRQTSRDTPITKEVLQPLIESTRVAFAHKVYGGPTPYQSIGERTLAYPDQQHDFPDYDTWKADPDNEGKGQLHYDRERETHERRRHRYEIEVTHPDGQREHATIQRRSDADGYPVWQATIPRDTITTPDMNFPGFNSEGHTFSSPEEAEAWIRTRLQAGSSRGDTEAKWADYAIPGPGGTARREYTNDVYTLPGEIPSNRLDPRAFQNTTHYPDYNPVATARGQQDYTVPDPANPEGPPLHGINITEAQSDIHQYAKREAAQEATRRQDRAIRSLVRGGKTPEEAARLVPLSKVERAGARKRWGYKSAAQTRALQEATDAATAAETAYDDFNPKAREAQQAAANAKQQRVQEILTEAGMDQWTIQQQIAFSNYLHKDGPSMQGGRSYTRRAQSFEDLSPTDQATWSQATAAQAKIDALETDPHLQDLRARANEMTRQNDRLYSTWQRLESTAQDLRRASRNQYADMPFKDSWPDLVAKRKLYEIATAPDKSFLLVTGGQENAEMYNRLGTRYSRMRYDPEEKMLHLYDTEGHEIHGHFGGQDQRFTVPISFQSVEGQPTARDFEPYMGAEPAKALADKVTSYQPRMTEGELRPVRRQPQESRRGITTSDPEDPDRWGTPNERQRALANWEEQEREYQAENEREQWEIEEVEVPTEELDLESDATQEYLAWQEAQAQSPYGDVSEHPTLPGLPQQNPPEPPVEPEYVTVTQYRTRPEWMSEREFQDAVDAGQHVFDSRREAEEHIAAIAEEAAREAELDPPSDEELYGPDGADLEDHYDPNYDPDEDRGDQDENAPAIEEEEPGHPGMVREPPAYDPAAHPAIEGQELFLGGKGMRVFYDEVFKSKIEKLLRRFGWEGEMQKIQITGGADPDTNVNRDAYGWIVYLTPELKAKIAKAGFSLMALALALRDTDAPEEIKNRLFRLAVLQERRKSPSTQTPGHMGKSPTPSQVVGGR